MDALLGLFGLAGIICGIVAIIIGKLRKKPIKIPGLILAVGFALFIAGLAINSQKDNLVSTMDPGIKAPVETITPGTVPGNVPSPGSSPQSSPAPDHTPAPADPASAQPPATAPSSTPAPAPTASQTPDPAPVSTSETPKELKVTFIDVGQADSILIQTPEGKNILIDAGNAADYAVIKACLDAAKVRRLDVVVATHPHEDHIGSMASVIKAYEIGKIYMPKAVTTTKTYENLLMAIKEKGLKVIEAKGGVSIETGDSSITAEILAPNSSSYDDLNDWSAVVKLSYGKTSFLFTGDAEAVSEREMLAKKYNLKADVLKVGHHGSRSSTTAEFLSAVSPKYAVISVEKGNDYGHPSEEVMNRLKQAGIPVYRTDESGTIVCVSDGETIRFSANPGSYTFGGQSGTSGTSISPTPAPTPASPKPTPTPSPTPSPDATGDRIVYWTPGGKSYHYTKDCSTLSRSKTILSGKLSECPKSDPCDICTR